MDGQAYLADVRRRFAYYRDLAERAMAQMDDASFFEARGSGSNSVAILAKHVAGNLLSRWTDILTTDGEKPDRRRDSEFVREAGEDRAALGGRWDAAWAVVTESLESLEADDLERTVTIRGEPHGVPEAINRSLAHIAYHVGQIVQLARDHAGSAWESLSIPRGKSDRFDAEMKRKFRE